LGYVHEWPSVRLPLRSGCVEILSSQTKQEINGRGCTGHVGADSIPELSTFKIVTVLCISEVMNRPNLKMCEKFLVLRNVCIKLKIYYDEVGAMFQQKLYTMKLIKPTSNTYFSFTVHCSVRVHVTRVIFIKRNTRNCR
jgi:hypothetical protein